MLLKFFCSVDRDYYMSNKIQIKYVFPVYFVWLLYIIGHKMGSNTLNKNVQGTIVPNIRSQQFECAQANRC